MAGTQKQLVRKANMEVQTRKTRIRLLFKQSDLDLPCLSRFLWQSTTAVSCVFSCWTNRLQVFLQRIFLFVSLFDLFLYVPSTIFQLYRDESSLVEPVLSWDKRVLLKDHNAVTPVRLERAALRSRVKHSSTEPMPSHQQIYITTYNGPDSLVDKASASGAGGRRFGSQCRRHWGSFWYGRLVSRQLVKRNGYQFLACLVPGKRMGFGK